MVRPAKPSSAEIARGKALIPRIDKVDEVSGATVGADRTEEGLTAGLGLDFGMAGYDATVDYAFTSFGILDSVHQFSLQFNF